MEGWLAGWKVVEATPPSSKPGWVYESCVASRKKVIYPMGGIARRPEDCGPLCVFVDAESAVDFVRQNFPFITSRSVFPCWYRPSTEDRVYFYNEEEHPFSDLPGGTVLAEEVVLCGGDVPWYANRLPPGLRVSPRIVLSLSDPLTTSTSWNGPQ